MVTSRKLCWDSARMTRQRGDPALTVCIPRCRGYRRQRTPSAVTMARAEREIKLSALTDSVCSLFGEGCVTPPPPRKMRCGNTHLSITLCNVDGSSGLCKIQSCIQWMLRVPHEDERLPQAGAPQSWRITSPSAPALTTSQMTTVWMCRWRESVVAPGRAAQSDGEAREKILRERVQRPRVMTAAASGFSTEHTRCRGAGRRVCRFPTPRGADAPLK